MFVITVYHNKTYDFYYLSTGRACPTVRQSELATVMIIHITHAIHIHELICMNL